MVLTRSTIVQWRDRPREEWKLFPMQTGYICWRANGKKSHRVIQEGLGIQTWEWHIREWLRERLLKERKQRIIF